jgi:Arc/MetJ-type ribon-helix-helix transcriptional regulator
MNTEPTTLALPSDLLAAVDKVVQEGRARSRDELVESALRLRLAELRRSALDAEFRHMADDVDYQRDVHQILGEFAQADWETFHEEPGPGASNRRL